MLQRCSPYKWWDLQAASEKQLMRKFRADDASPSGWKENEGLRWNECILFFTDVTKNRGFTSNSDWIKCFKKTWYSPFVLFPSLQQVAKVHGSTCCSQRSPAAPGDIGNSLKSLQDAVIYVTWWKRHIWPGLRGLQRCLLKLLLCYPLQVKYIPQLLLKIVVIIFSCVCL